MHWTPHNFLLVPTFTCKFLHSHTLQNQQNLSSQSVTIVLHHNWISWFISNQPPFAHRSSSFPNQPIIHFSHQTIHMHINPSYLGVGYIKVYISTGIPTRVVGTCFCGENLGNAGNLSICFNFKVFSFVMSCNNKKVVAIFGCYITFCAITQYL